MTTLFTKLTHGRVSISVIPGDDASTVEWWLEDVARCIAEGKNTELEVLAVLPGDRLREMRDKFGANCVSCGCCKCAYCLSFEPCECTEFDAITVTDRQEIRDFLAAEAR
jgi:hypothetical protein